MKFRVWNREERNLTRLMLETEDPDTAIGLAKFLSQGGYAYITGWDPELAYIGNWLDGVEYVNFIEQDVNKLLLNRP